MEKGDIVKITDGSYAIRVDRYEKWASIGLCKDEFEIIAEPYFGSYFVSKNTDIPVHDIFIKNTITGAIYLHSKAFCRVVEQKQSAVEMTLTDIEKKLGYPVKIVK